MQKIRLPKNGYLVCNSRIHTAQMFNGNEIYLSANKSTTYFITVNVCSSQGYKVYDLEFIIGEHAALKIPVLTANMFRMKNH